MEERVGMDIIDFGTARESALIERRSVNQDLESISRDVEIILAGKNIDGFRLKPKDTGIENLFTTKSVLFVLANEPNHVTFLVRGRNGYEIIAHLEKGVATIIRIGSDKVDSKLIAVGPYANSNRDRVAAMAAVLSSVSRYKVNEWLVKRNI